MVLGAAADEPGPVQALCGKKWVPNRNPDRYPVCPTCKEIFEKNGMKFYVFESRSTNQDGQTTVKGTWTNIVRGG